MLVKTLFFDESCYTGEDLLNREQPTFAYASTTLPNSDATSLVKSLFSFSRASELKHTNLSRTTRGKDAIINLIRRLVEKSFPVKLYIAHKEYALLTYFIDFPVEESFRHAGCDLYKKGFNVALSNAAFYALRPLDAPDVLTPFLRNFQQLYTSRKYEDWIALCRDVRIDYLKYKEYRKILDYFLLACQSLGYEYFRNLPRHTFDLGFSAFVAIVMAWSETASRNFSVIHDTSSMLDHHVREAAVG